MKYPEYLFAFIDVNAYTTAKVIYFFGYDKVRLLASKTKEPLEAEIFQPMQLETKIVEIQFLRSKYIEEALILSGFDLAALQNGIASLPTKTLSSDEVKAFILEKHNQPTT